MSETPTNRTPEVAAVLLSAERIAVFRRIYRSYFRLREARDINHDPQAEDIGILLAAYEAQAEQIRLLTDDLDVHRAIVSQDFEHEFMLMHKLKKSEARADAAEARAAEAEAQVAMMRVELAEQERELSYERQMRLQQTASGRILGTVLNEVHD